MQIVYLMSNDKPFEDSLSERFAQKREFKFKKIQLESFDLALKEVPAAIIVDEDELEEDVEVICNRVRSDEDNSITPIIVVSSNSDKKHVLNCLGASATYYLVKPVDVDYLYYTMKTITNLLSLNRKISPLTNLPGNVQIQAEMKNRLSKKSYFVMLYFDLDNFKAYNDYYGFVKGDEVIKFQARVIVDNVHKNSDDNNFVGHIGGDDFVAIVEDENYEEICQNVIKEFDAGISKYFSEDDIRKGYLEIANRKGIIEEFPITSISIGAVEVAEGRFRNSLEIGEAAAQVKHLAKTIPGSTYVIDRRKNATT